jgi:hypothetical protein
MEDDFELEFSPLCQSISSGGKSVQVHIYGDGEGKWILEVVDEFGNSTVWNDLFDTDSAALTEVKKAILEDRITSFIGPEDGKGDGGGWK